MAEDVPRQPRVPPWLLTFAVVLSIPLGLYALVFAYGQGRVRATEGRWAHDGRGFADLLARHPDLATNSAAGEIEALAARLGIDLVPRSDGAGADAPRFALGSALQPYLAAELRSEASSPAPAPPEVADWLRLHAGDIDALVLRLSEGPAPRWRSEPSQAHEAPTPNIPGHLNVQRVLVAAALEHGRGSDAERAQACLDAAWKLNDSLWERPDLISQLMAGAIARQHFSALRKIDGLPATWDARLARRHARDTFATALQFEARASLELARAPGRALADASPKEDVRWLGGIAMPALLAGAAGTAERTRQLVALDAASAPCLLDPATLPAKLPPASSWNPVEKMALSDFASSLTRMGHVSFHAELTRHVMRARRERLAEVVTGACADWTFRTEVLPDGGVSVAFEGVLPPDPSQGPQLPFRWGPDPPARR